MVSIGHASRNEFLAFKSSFVNHSELVILSKFWKTLQRFSSKVCRGFPKQQIDLDRIHFLKNYQNNTGHQGTFTYVAYISVSM